MFDITLKISELQDAYPQFNFSSYMKKVHVHCNMSEDDEITIHEPSLVNKTLKLVKNSSEKVVANYLFSRFIRDIFDQYITNDDSSCYEKANDNLGLATYALYVRDHFNKSSEIMIKKLIENIRKSTSLVLDEVSLLRFLSFLLIRNFDQKSLKTNYIFVFFI